MGNTVPVEVVLMVTLHRHLYSLHLHLCTILHRHLFTIHLLLVVIPLLIVTALTVASNNHKKTATKSVLLVVQPAVDTEERVVKEEREDTVASVDTEATVERVVKVEKEDAVVSTTDMHPVKPSVNLRVVTTDLTHLTDRVLSVRTMIIVGIASLC